VETLMDRRSTDGNPYYCTTCGAGFDEFMACEMPDCELESKQTAKQRQRRLLKAKTKKRIAKEKK
jgi:hypothetical protein